MRPIELQHFLALCYAAKEPAMVLGSPGRGKTHIGFHVAKSLGVGYETRRVPHLDVVDLRGLADLNNTVTHWKRPDWLPQAGEGILWMGEATAGIPAIQATLYELFEVRPDGSRWCAGHRVADGWIPMADGNKLTDKAVSHRLSTALVSRVAMCELVNNHEDWTDWAMGGTAEPVPRYKSVTGDDNLIAPEIIAFVRKFPELLNNFDPAKVKDNEPYAAERSWARLSNFYNVCKGNGISRKLAPGGKFCLSLEATSAFVGKPAASSFLTFLDLFEKVPSIEEILLTPDKAPVPDEPALKYAVACMAGRYLSPANFDKLVRYLCRLEKSLEVLAVMTALKVNRAADGKIVDKTKDVTQCKPFVQWANRNQDVFVRKD